MSNLEAAKLQEKLDLFTEKLQARSEEFRREQGFEDIHGSFLEQVQRHNEALRRRVEEAAHSGSAWELTKAALWREYKNLVNELLLFEEKLDTFATRADRGILRDPIEVAHQ